MSAAATIETGRKRGVWRGRIFVGVLLFSLGVGFLTLGTLFFQVIREGIAYVDPVLLTNPPSSDPGIAGARPAILATLYIGVLLILFTVPIGVGTARGAAASVAGAGPRSRLAGLGLRPRTSSSALCRWSRPSSCCLASLRMAFAWVATDSPGPGR